MTYLAHSANDAGRDQPLADHLAAVARLAAGFGSAFGAADESYLAGLLHDVGKASELFQSYVRGRVPRGGDHSTAGACLAPAGCLPVPFAVAGHHAGLADRADLVARLRQGLADAQPVADRTLRLLGIDRWPATPPTPPFVEHDALEAELLVRMVFSALVDADYLDTESHFDGGKAAARQGWECVEELWARFGRHQEELLANAPLTPVNRLRHRIYEQCLRMAREPQGLYTLTVPTGGGKTLSAMGFALQHALRWGLRRVIVVIPFTSIVEQTADVYRQALGDAAVLEHHSAVAWDQVEDNDRLRWALASENWDAPVVVTTSVQFFESLLANRSSQCRKLHNIARSVVIVDEVQTLPTGLLQPSFQVLSSLCKRYGTTVVLTTATHPAYQRIMDWPAAPVAREIMEAPEALFAGLRRVEYQRGDGHGRTQMTWAQVSEMMQETPQAMAVVNTRKDARALYAQLPEGGREHLSTDLCGAHRREVLARVRQRLVAGEACHLATTQLVEAGVDLDFALVLRATGPLDRIVQAAGRCNREGRLEHGKVVIFEPAEGGMPPGAYRAGALTASAMLAQEPPSDLHDPAVYTDYFGRLYDAVDLDEKQIARDRSRLMFETVASKYRLIPDDTVSVAVEWGEGKGLLSGLEARGGPLTREDLRALQPYLVSLRRWDHLRAIEAGHCREITPGLWRWEGRYDASMGIVLDESELPFLYSGEGR
jgi:CRISPR-associated endonuclease/helicase Cas3